MASAAMAAVPEFKSIQGEQQGKSQYVAAEEIDVEDYLAGAPPEFAECRARGRHWFPSPKDWSAVGSGGVTSEGYLIRKTKCSVCNVIERVEHFEVYEKTVFVGKRRGKSTRLRLARKYTTGYQDAEKNGVKYAAPPGIGKILPRQVTESLVSSLIPKKMSVAQVIEAARQAVS